MKYLDIIHEEGTFAVTSVNETINVNITGIHPELILEDNSMLIFDKVGTYYKLISNADLYSEIDSDIDLEILIDEFTEEADTVTDLSYKGYDVNSIFKIKYEDGYIYYILRNGINHLSSNN